MHKRIKKINFYLNSFELAGSLMKFPEIYLVITQH